MRKPSSHLQASRALTTVRWEHDLQLVFPFPHATVRQARRHVRAPDYQIRPHYVTLAR